jgi:hypothetical protein
VAEWIEAMSNAAMKKSIARWVSRTAVLDGHDLRVQVGVLLGEVDEAAQSVGGFVADSDVPDLSRCNDLLEPLELFAKAGGHWARLVRRRQKVRLAKQRSHVPI